MLGANLAIGLSGDRGTDDVLEIVDDLFEEGQLEGRLVGQHVAEQR